MTASLTAEQQKRVNLGFETWKLQTYCSIFLRFQNLNLDFQHSIMSYLKTPSCFWPLLSRFQINIVGELFFCLYSWSSESFGLRLKSPHCKNVDGSHLNNITFSGLWAQRTIGRSSQAKSGAWLDIRGGGIKGKVTRSLTPHMLASHPH